MTDDEHQVIRVTDDLDHDLPVVTKRYAEAMLRWLDLEAAAEEISPGLAEVRDMLRAQVDRDA